MRAYRGYIIWYNHQRICRYVEYLNPIFFCGWLIVWWMSGSDYVLTWDCFWIWTLWTLDWYFCTKIPMIVWNCIVMDFFGWSECDSNLKNIFSSKNRCKCTTSMHWYVELSLCRYDCPQVFKANLAMGTSIFKKYLWCISAFFLIILPGYWIWGRL